jgi:plastocyanin
MAPRNACIEQALRATIARPSGNLEINSTGERQERAMTVIRRSGPGVAVVLATVIAGCGSTGGNPVFDLSGSDMTRATMEDMTPPPPDLSMPADLTSLPDLSPPPDLSGGGGPKTFDVMVGQGGTKFSPKDVTIHKGDTVKWTWAASNHNVVSGSNATADGTFCSPNDMNCAGAPLSNAGATYSHTFNAAGTFNYFCAPHAGAGMVGSVTVQ